MSIESTILVENFSDDSQPSTFRYTDKSKGWGYHRRLGSAQHTAQISYENFVGEVKFQATLALYPSDNDWFDIVYDDNVSAIIADSTAPTDSIVRNFTGNFVFVRAVYRLEQGIIQEIRYNY
jgi:hypothetical protein